MQLKTKMNRRFYWATVILLSMWFVHSSLAAPCENGIMGTFMIEDDLLDSLSITPWKDTRLFVTDRNKDEKSILIYMTFDKNSMKDDCKKGKFSIANHDNSSVCFFDYTFDVAQSALTVNNKTLGYKSEGPYEVSFELKPSSKQLAFRTLSGAMNVDPINDECKKFPDKAENFSLAFPRLSSGGNQSQECSIQFELKGEYEAREMFVDNVACTPEAPGSSNNNETESPTSSTKAQAPPITTTEDLKTWWILVAVCGGILIVIFVVAILIIIYCLCFKKKASTDEDVEAAPKEEESDKQPTDSEQGKTEQDGIDHTQNPDDKAANTESNAEDGPEEKTKEEEGE